MVDTTLPTIQNKENVPTGVSSLDKEKKTEENQEILQQISSKTSKLERSLEGISKGANGAANIGLGASAAVFSGDPTLAAILGGASKGLGKVVEKGAGLGSRALANRRAKKQEPQDDPSINNTQTNQQPEQIQRVQQAQPNQSDNTDEIKASRLEKILEGTSNKADAAGNIGVGASLATFSGDPTLAAIMSGASKGLGKVVGKGSELGARGLANRRAKKQKEQDADSKTTLTKVNEVNTESPSLVPETNNEQDDTIINQSFTNLTDNVEEIKTVIDDSDIQETLEDRIVPSLESMVNLLQDGLPTAQEKAVEKRALIKARRAKKDSNTLERTSGDSPDAGGGLTILGTGLLGTLFTKIKTGISTSLSFIFKKLPGMLLRFIPRLITKIPFIGFVFSLFKGLFDGVKSLLNGASIGQAIMTTITSFADSLIKIFSFGLLDLSTLQDWFAPVFDMIFGGLDKLIGFLSFGFLDLENVVSFLFSPLTDTIERMGNFFDTVKEFWANKLSAIGDSINAAFSAVGDFFSNLGDSIRSAIAQVVPGPLRKFFGLEDKTNEDGSLTETGKRDTILNMNTVKRSKEEIIDATISNLPRQARGSQTVNSPDIIVPSLGTVNEQSANNPTVAESPLIFGTNERDEAARVFSDMNRQSDIAPTRVQAKQAREMNQQLSNNLTMMNQNNVSQNQNITIGRSARKQDYLAGSMNREMDFSGT